MVCFGMSKVPVFVLLGRGGAGKSKIGEFYSKKYGLPIIIVGDEIRKLAEKGHKLSVAAVRAMKQAKPFSPQAFVDAIEHVISEDPRRFESGLIIDGFPRWPECISFFEEFLRKHNFRPAKVIELRVPKHQSIKRQIRRTRESKETILKREQHFREQEFAVIEYYRRKGLVAVLPTKRYKRPKKRQQNYFIPNEAKQLHKIIRASTRRRK
jgi:adenylate kinase family enzyme